MICDAGCACKKCSKFGKRGTTGPTGATGLAGNPGATGSTGPTGAAAPTSANVGALVRGGGVTDVDPDVAPVTLNWGDAIFNDGGMWNGNTSFVIQPGQAGRYQIDLWTRLASLVSPGSSTATVAIEVNGVAIADESKITLNSDTEGVTLAALALLAVGDVVTATASTSGPDGLRVFGGQGDRRFGLIRVGT